MINIGSLFLVFAVLWQFIRKKSEHELYISIFTITIFVGIFVERGYFISVGSQQISYKMFSEFFLFVFSVIFAIRNKNVIKSSIFRSALIVIFALVIGWLSLIIFPSEATGGTTEVSWDMILVSGYSRQPIIFRFSMMVYIIQAFMYIINALVAFSFFERNDWIKILKNISFLSKIVIYIGLIELAVVYILKSNLFYSIEDYFFGRSTSTMEFLSRGSGYGLCGLTKESSHYVFVISIVFILNAALHYYDNKLIDKYYTLQICIVTIFLFSMSFSSIYYLFCVLLLLFSLKLERKGYSSVKLFGMILGTIIFVIVVIQNLSLIADRIGMDSFWGRRLYSVLEEYELITNGNWLHASTALEWSNRVRLGSTYETFRLLFYRPFFGLGFASTTAHSSLAMLISGVGIIGTILYIRAC